ncbi:activator of the mannose operon (transcriptional antiterminator) [Salirhabdus euzebyi]|uniref:Activator of the mannose operon (Transcriptional antiterminator) n=1 Tax=Salirhabdus euzebyi TaxID=394506 RepID=A0A841Q5X2_9BACI|nr:BglG family transcription antiterminator [Salirhabdus euzebyi]MBB6453791.1 activator of the mannose operon (transcriptional antiterminator) [Salirhabdus euzebyi]
MHSRRSQLLHILLNTKEYSAVMSLSEMLYCSEKTIRNDLKALDEYLQDYQTLKIIRRPSLGVLLEGTDREKNNLKHKLNMEPSKMSGNNLFLHIIKLLLTSDEAVSSQRIANALYVSKGTVSAKLTEVEQWLSTYNLELIRRPNVGLKVDGPERDWRRALSDVVEQLADVDSFVLNLDQLHLLEGVLHPYEIAIIENEVRKIDRQLEFPLTDQSIVNLTVHIAIAIKRIKKGFRIEMPEYELIKLREKKEFLLATFLSEELEQKLSIKVPLSEIGYITLHFLGAHVRFAKEHLNAELDKTIGKIDQEAFRYVQQLVKKVSLVIDEQLYNDQELLVGLSIHFHSALNRLKHGLGMKNPMIKEIKNMYRYTFEVLLSFIPSLEQELQVDIPEDEVGYMVLHFQAALERLEKSRKYNLKTIIVCATGAGTSKLLEAKLSSLLPEMIILDTVSISHMKKMIQEQKPDFIISTVPLKEKLVPTVIVSPLLPLHEQKKVMEFYENSKQLNSQKSTAYPTLLKKISSDLIFLNINAKDKMDVIQILAQNMYENDYVTKKFGEDAKRREKLSSTYIGGGIAIPHGNVHEIIQSGIAVGRLTHPINWSNEKVQLVFMLANKEIAKEDVKKLFSELAILVEDEKVLKKLQDVGTVEEFCNAFQ